MNHQESSLLLTYNRHIENFSEAGLSEDEIESIPANDPIGLPEFDIKKLYKFDGCDICGGGRNECLKEITLLLDAMTIEYNIVSSFVY